ncbi:MAG: hypothetical protein Q4F13_07825 [Pseudomonadota bacterium]|nr:hypothetical protein [Pseudomonadota bacterium]
MNPNALPGRPMAGVPPVGPMPPNPALPHAQVLPVPAQAGGLAQAGVNGVPLRAPPAPPLPVAQAVANPQAMAAAAALGRGWVVPQAAQAAQVAHAAQAAQKAQAALVAQMARAGLAQVAAAAALAGQSALGPLPGLGGRAVLTVQQAQAQTVWAQQVLAQALGRLAAGQMGVGAAAAALAQGQLAWGAGRVALSQAALPGPGLPPAVGAVQRGWGAAGAAAVGQAVAGGVAADRLARAQQPGAGKVAGDGQPLPGQVPVAMPRVLAQALALAPKRRKRGTYDRVEAVDRHTPRQQAPEMEDEDFWDGAGDDADEAGDALSEAPVDADARRQVVAEAVAQHYRAMHAWLVAHGQQVLLRELAAGRCVMVLAPPDGTHLRLMAHLLRPDAGVAGAGGLDAVRPAGAMGRAWALAARWSATLPADGQWRVWRLRQHVDAEGVWRVAASQPDRHTPRLVAVDGAAAAVAGAAVVPVGEEIVVAEPRRLRRLMGSQWTMTVLRVPVPLADVAPAGGVRG